MATPSQQGLQEPPGGFDTALFLKVLSFLVIPLVYALQANGVVDISWKLSAAIYLIVLTGYLWTFHKWQVPRQWSRIRRYGCCLVGCVVLLWLSGLGVRNEYVKEHANPPQKLTSPGPVLPTRRGA